MGCSSTYQSKGLQGRVHCLEYGPGYIYAGEYTHGARTQQGACLQLCRNKVKGGYVSIPEIFFERQLDERFHIIRYLSVAHAAMIDCLPPNVKAEMRSCMHQIALDSLIFAC